MSKIVWACSCRRSHDSQDEQIECDKRRPREDEGASIDRFVQSMKKTPDFESALKRAWDEIECGVPTVCAKTLPCRGHAALLKMVDAHHVENCICDSTCPDEDCIAEIRRLRAAVGAEE